MVAVKYAIGPVMYEICHYELTFWKSSLWT